MKALVVDNGTIHLQKIIRSLEDNAEIEVVRYSPQSNLNDQGIDLIILSGGGGEGQEIDDTYTDNELWYEKQIEFVLNTNKPVVGICMGFEIIARAFGSKVESVGAYYQNFRPIHLIEYTAEKFGMKEISQYEAHKMGVKNVVHPLTTLAYSATGVEIIKHKTRPIIATQFHPEVPGGTLHLNDLLQIL
jgi:GMP synthase-like glutamine amidotransferase